MRKSGVFLIAAVLAGLAAPAAAEVRFNFGYRNYNPGYRMYYNPYYEPPPRYTRYYYDDREFEPDYYEDEQPRVYRPKTKKLKQQALPVPEAKPAKKAKPSLISCAKASKIVAEYGFSSVKSTNCKGAVYAFKAVRDGKSFTIKLSAKNGELTEVKKL